jgi:hypothetical protein
MSNSFKKEELHSLINSFEKYTINLEQPYVSWDCDGVHTPENARKIVDDGKVPEKAFVICSKRPNEDYWDSIFIEKNHEHDSKYYITTREMGLADELSNSEDECIKLASKMLSKYVLM